MYAASWLPLLHLIESTSGSQLSGRLHPLEKSLVCIMLKGSSDSIAIVMIAFFRNHQPANMAPKIGMLRKFTISSGLLVSPSRLNRAVEMFPP